MAANQNDPFKAHVLRHDDNWRLLYEELVVPGLLPDELFWADKKHALEAASAYIQSREPKTNGTPQQQAAAVLKRIKGVADGGKGEVKFRLTPDIITAIYTNLPLVKELHSKRVSHPDGDSLRLTEKEFWTQFFVSQTFGKELGVADEFLAKEGNIFDAVFSDAEHPLFAVDAGPRREHYSAHKLNPLIDIARNEGNWFVDHGGPTKSLPLIAQLNRQSESDLSAHAVTESTSEEWSVLQDLMTPDAYVEPMPEHGAIDKSRPPLTSVEYDPDWLAGKLMSFEQYQTLASGESPSPSDKPFMLINEADFTDGHFAIVVRQHCKLMQTLRLYWQYQPMSTADRRGTCQSLLNLAENIAGSLPANEWPDSERERAMKLLVSVHNCLIRAREHYQSQPVPPPRRAK